MIAIDHQIDNELLPKFHTAILGKCFHLQILLCGWFERLEVIGRVIILFWVISHNQTSSRLRNKWLPSVTIAGLNTRQPCHGYSFSNFQLFTCSRVATERKLPIIHSNRIVWDFTFLIAFPISQSLGPAGKG